MTDAVRDTAARAPGPAHAANLVLGFLLELGALAALAFWGVHTGQSPVADIVLGAGAPLLAAVVWGTLAAPKSKLVLLAVAIPAATRLAADACALPRWLRGLGYALAPILVIGGAAFVITSDALSAVLAASLLLLLLWVGTVGAALTRRSGRVRKAAR